MADTAFLLGLVAVAVVLTLGVIAAYPRTVREFVFEPLESARTVLGIVFAVIAAWTALRSGVVWMMLLALGVIAFGTMFVYFEQPHKDLR